MSNSLKRLAVVLGLSLTLAGCRVGWLGKKISPEEEAYQAQMQIIEEGKRKHKSFSEMDLVDPATDRHRAIIFHKDKGDAGVELMIMGVLPDFNRGFYEVWLVDSQTKEAESLGVLEYTGIQSYRGEFGIEKELGLYHRLLITRETVADEVQEKTIASGVIPGI